MSDDIYTYDIIKINPFIINHYKSNDKVPLKCLHCGKIHSKQKKEIKRCINRGYDNFCSLKCRGAYKQKRTKVGCKECGVIFLQNSTNQQFCNHSCAANHTNKIRGNDHIEKQKKTLLKTLQHKFKNFEPKIIYPYTKVTFRPCSKCDNIFPSIRGKRYCSTKCKFDTSAKNYRNCCKFKLNNRDHPELFNGDLIKEYGWYQPSNSPSPNLSGVTWDHLYRCSDGYKNNIDPEIMSHPANAELIPWKINYHRKKSMLTYEELLSRIKLWDFGNRCLPTFY